MGVTVQITLTVTIDLQEQFVHNAVDQEVLKLRPIASSDNVADLLTGPLGANMFHALRKMLMGL